MVISSVGSTNVYLRARQKARSVSPPCLGESKEFIKMAKSEVSCCFIFLDFTHNSQVSFKRI